MKYFKSPWGTSLIIISTLFTILLLSISVIIVLNSDGDIKGAFILLAILIGAALFTIRGYTITPDAILVHRLLWKTSLPLAGLEKVQYKPDAMQWRNIHTFGNGGLYSFTGRFRNKELGAFRAFVTDPHRTVVLRYPTRTVLVSPDSPDEFEREIKAIGHTA